MDDHAVKILVADDEPQLRRALDINLRIRDYDVDLAATGHDALQKATQRRPDLVILDLGLPGMDGQEVIASLRGWTDVPIIVLSVREAQEQKVAALDSGADDYVTKPFAMEELLARMRAVRRRVPTERARSVLRIDDLEVDLARQAVKLRGELVHLTPTEYRLLETFVTNPGKLLTHRWLLQRVWGPGYATENQYLRVFMRQLRAKLADDPARPRFIITESGLGYRWKPDPDD